MPADLDGADTGALLPPYEWADPEPVRGYPEYRVAYRDGDQWVTVAAPMHPRDAMDIGLAWADEYPVEIWSRLPDAAPTLYRRLGPTPGRAR